MSEPATPGYRVTDSGIQVTGFDSDRCEVYFDDQHVWSFDVEGREQVRWPVAMRRWLDGTARVRIRAGEHVRFDEEKSFGTSQTRIAFVDDHGIPVHIDKWGFVQRPFAGRGNEVISAMVDTARQIIQVCRETVGVEPWLAFGTLLGAARDGHVIGHDSDIDLAYLSTADSPVDLNREMFALTRALRAAGLKVVNKNGSFLTVLFTGPDGANCSIDLYTCFYLGDLLHESATVRTRVPRSAVEPLGTMVFEGHELPVPADPAALLEVSYGPGWRVPDPNFRHQPGPEITERFDGWFGTWMKFRRDWERQHRETPDAALQRPTEMGAWALAQGADRRTFVDVGSGVGANALAAARAGLEAVAVDYGRGSYQRAEAVAEAEGLDVHFHVVNLYVLRDALTSAAVLMRDTDGPRVVLAAGIHEALVPEARRGFLRYVTTLTRGGGLLLLDHAVDVDGWQPGPRAGGRRFASTTDSLIADLAGHGLTAVASPAPDRGDGVRRIRIRAEEQAS